MLWASSSGRGTNGVGTYDQALSSAVGGIVDPFSRAPAVTGGSGRGQRDFVDGKPLVAVYFTGQARSLNRTKCSIDRNLFQPLIALGFQPVVFALGEMDANAGLYQEVLGEKALPAGVTLGGLEVISRIKGPVVTGHGAKEASTIWTEPITLGLFGAIGAMLPVAGLA